MIKGVARAEGVWNCQLTSYMYVKIIVYFLCDVQPMRWDINMTERCSNHFLIVIVNVNGNTASLVQSVFPLYIYRNIKLMYNKIQIISDQSFWWKPCLTLLKKKWNMTKLCLFMSYISFCLLVDIATPLQTNCTKQKISNLAQKHRTRTGTVIYYG